MNPVFIGLFDVRNCSWCVISGILRQAMVGLIFPWNIENNIRPAHSAVSYQSCGCVRCATRPSTVLTINRVRAELHHRLFLGRPPINDLLNQECFPPGRRRVDRRTSRQWVEQAFKPSTIFSSKKVSVSAVMGPFAPAQP